MRYRVVLHVDEEDGGYNVEVPDLPGCLTQGHTREEALENAREAIQAYLESLRAHGDPIPEPSQEELVEIEGF